MKTILISHGVNVSKLKQLLDSNGYNMNGGRLYRCKTNDTNNSISNHPSKNTIFNLNDINEKNNKPNQQSNQQPNQQSNHFNILDSKISGYVEENIY